MWLLLSGRTQPPREEQISPLAERLSKQRPWLSAEENWLAAERALRQKPWRPWVISFSGEKERSGWDWADLLLKVSVPVLILGLSTAYSFVSAKRQEAITIEQRESAEVTNSINRLQPLFIDKGLRTSAPDAEVRGIARGLTLAALSQVSNSERKRLIVQFLLDSGLNTKPSSMISLSEADLVGADLTMASLEGADLSRAKLDNADLSAAYLSGANLSWATLMNSSLKATELMSANLAGAVLAGTDLTGANLRGSNLGMACTSNETNTLICRRAILLAARLNGANLTFTNFEAAELLGSDLSAADLSGANLKNSSLKYVRWNKDTRWPARSSFAGATDIPEALKKQLGL